MYLYQVILIAKIPRPHLQTPIYFSGDEFQSGQLVEVPLGKRKVPAVIVSRKDAGDKKLEIKKYSFQLKKIEKDLTSGPILPQEFLDTAADLADYYYAPLGLMLQRMLPPFFSKPGKPLLDMLESLPGPHQITNKQKVTTTLFISTDRSGYYKKITRDRNTILLVPEYDQLPSIKNILPEESSAFLKKQTTYAQWRNIWKKAYKGEVKHVSGTRSALFAPLKDIDQIIVENQNNDSYVSWDQHPKFDARYAAEVIADKFNLNLVYGDTIPSINTYYKARNRKWEIIKEKQKKSAEIEINDMRKELKGGNLSMISEPLRDRIKSLNKDQKMLLLIPRRGLASAIVCRDCGFLPKCPDCDSALVLHNHKSAVGDRALICHHCGTKKIPPKKCPACKSERIKFMGGGTQLAMNQVSRIAPSQKIAILDSDSVDGPEEVKSILKDFSNNKYNILIGTQLALKEHLLPKLDHAAILMADTIMNLPLYDANEKVFGTIWRIKQKTKGTVTVQTYNPDITVFDSVKNDDFEDFFSEELEKRKLLHLPPYSQIIRISYSNKKKKVAEKEAYTLKKKLETQIISIKKSQKETLPKFEILGPAPAFREKLKGEYTWYIQIKWPVDDKGVMENIKIRNKLLRIIPQGWEIVVNPVDVL